MSRGEEDRLRLDPRALRQTDSFPSAEHQWLSSSSVGFTSSCFEVPRSVFEVPRSVFEVPRSGTCEVPRNPSSCFEVPRSDSEVPRLAQPAFPRSWRAPRGTSKTLVGTSKTLRGTSWRHEVPTSVFGLDLTMFFKNLFKQNSFRGFTRFLSLGPGDC